MAASCFSRSRFSAGCAADPQHDVSVHGRLPGAHTVLSWPVSAIRRHREGQQRGAAGVLVHSNEEAVLFLNAALNFVFLFVAAANGEHSGGRSLEIRVLWSRV